MKIVAAADWRDRIPFETPMIVAEISPGEPARCAICGADSALRPRTQLWAFKHRHPKNHDGFVRFYCAEHVPPAVVAVAPPVHERIAPRRERRVSAPRAAAVVERPPTLCPDCFVEVPASGICGMCGNVVTAPAAG
ncbi:glucose-6-phosphate dehydrogenase [Microbacterium rhizomatis]|uniref:Glucose-6-phosphate dehydrogenase n=1 Tax=Microbacterium rhizomatis TaxID=1631477 RepID=A0A5J5IZS4_9MICO|nr:glucose-6-phosphate dehydrogenase [Microbacterium rhizomatis]KAA9105048.1 glucose-6-phosphate dehydrogenase [Microbacterium rhizomatis]